jgi:hypothetical protein
VNANPYLIVACFVLLAWALSATLLWRFKADDHATTRKLFAAVVRQRNYWLDFSSFLMREMGHDRGNRLQKDWEASAGFPDAYERKDP